MMKKKSFQYIIFSLIPLLVLLGSLELILRVAGFKYSSTPLEMQSPFENPLRGVEDVIRYNNRDGIVRFVKDPKQLWVPKDSPLEKYSTAREPGTLRIAALGCSCTARCVGTEESYPSLLERQLNKASSRRVEVLNAGVGSYSSFQGLQRLKHAVLKYKPDVLTVFFGWNDHWIAAVPDHQLRIKSPTEVALINFMEKFRIYQWMNYWVSKWRAPAEDPSKSKKPSVRMRVPLTEYEKNLNAMIDIAEARQIRLLLMTAPARFDEWQPISIFPFPSEMLIPIHRNYNQTVRETARKRNVPLLDLEAIVAQNPDADVISKDGIHFSASGCAFVADRLAHRLKELNLV